MARDSFDFDSVNLPEGGFYHSAGDSQGTMMVGWGRRGRNKWVQLTQAEILGFVASAAEMIRTDDETLTQLLARVTEHLNPPGRWASTQALAAAVQAGEAAAEGAANAVTQLVLTGVPIAEAFQRVNVEYGKAAAA